MGAEFIEAAGEALVNERRGSGPGTGQAIVHAPMGPLLRDYVGLRCRDGSSQLGDWEVLDESAFDRAQQIFLDKQSTSKRNCRGPLAQMFLHCGSPQAIASFVLPVCIVDRGRSTSGKFRCRGEFEDDEDSRWLPRM